MRQIALTLNIVVAVSIIAFAWITLPAVAAQEQFENVAKDDMYCLQQNIYFEARNQSINGQIAVAWVTLHRVDDPRYPNTICEVVWQRKQFSWTHDGKSDKPNKSVAGKRAWEDAGLIAKVVVFDWIKGSNGPVAGATHYHANYVLPYWAAKLERLGKVGAHIFYK
jgi:spore germination cell wall hydrolase CwlJ-like protein